MQIFVHFPLLVSFPQYSSLVTDEIIKIATFDIVTTLTLNKYEEVDIFKLFLNVPENSKDKELNDLLAKYDRTGYSSNFFILNLGLLFLSFCFMLILVIFTLTCKPLEDRSQYIKNKLDGTRENLYWNGFIRFFIEACLEIFIAYSINTAVIEKTGFRWSTNFDYVNNISLVVISIASILIVVFILLFYPLNYAKWREDDFKMKYGSAYQDLKED